MKSVFRTIGIRLLQVWGFVILLIFGFMLFVYPFLHLLGHMTWDE